MKIFLEMSLYKALKTICTLLLLYCPPVGTACLTTLLLIQSFKRPNSPSYINFSSKGGNNNDFKEATPRDTTS